MRFFNRVFACWGGRPREERGRDQRETVTSEAKRLRYEDFSNVQKFTLNGLKTEARVTRVLDGDTVEVVFFRRGEIEKHILRIAGIDAPEMKPKKKDFFEKGGEAGRQKHKKAALVAKEFLERQILNKVVQIDLLTEEKFGRLLGIVYANELSDLNLYTLDVGELMLAQGLAKSYDGLGPKSAFSALEIDAILQRKTQ